MSRRAFRTIGAVSLALACTAARPVLAAAPAKPTEKAPQTVRYDVDLRDAGSQYVGVRMCLDDAPLASTQVAMPAWTPGSYKIRDYARHVTDVRATGRGRSRLAVAKTDKQTWVVANAGQPFCVDYRVFAAQPSVRDSYLDPRYALLNGASLFLYVEHELDRPARVDLALPKGWTAHSSLGTSTKGRGYAALDYDRLVDSPILAGETQVSRFRVATTDFEYITIAPSGTNADLARLAREAKAVTEVLVKNMGSLDADRYLFLMVLDARGGGLEHLASTAMMTDAWSFANAKGYRSAAELAAHEFFHAWNVKRLHATELARFDYAAENYTDLLWFHEGFTNAIAERAVLAAGIDTPDAYLKGLESTWNRYLERPGRNYEAVDRLSRDAWIKEYQSAANHPNTTISYYTKGETIGVALDLELRLRAAKHQRYGSLEGLFARMWRERPPGHDRRSIVLADVIAAASAEAGEDMQAFFASYVTGTDEVALPALLTRVGIEVRERPAWVDAEGKPVEEKANLRPYTGLVFAPGQSKISNVEPNSPAADVGFHPDDEIIALEGAKIRNGDEFRDHLVRSRPGSNVRVVFFRQQALEERTIRVGENPARVFHFRKPTANPHDASTAEVQAKWLHEAKANEARTPR